MQEAPSDFDKRVGYRKHNDPTELFCANTKYFQQKGGHSLVRNFNKKGKLEIQNVVFPQKVIYFKAFGAFFLQVRETTEAARFKQ